ncbi:MAG: D-2-hydroxyacid dehydrogenase [Chloroflexi bacterium]|nr:D-2-hydroxyacid dehydrogenase [Chloroflexota bacterium]
MQPINVVFTWPSSEEATKMVAAADPRVRVKKALYIEPEERRDLRRKKRLNELERYPVPVSPELKAALADADAIIGLDYPNDLLKLAPRLKLVQMIGAGIDHLNGMGLMESNVTLTVLGGWSSLNIAEFAVTMMLMHAKHMKDYVVNAPTKAWKRYMGESLSGKTLGVVGYGRIGSETARMCKPFGMRVLASRRTPSAETTPHVDKMYRADQLHEMLPQCDYIVVAVASTAETRHLIGEREIAMMKKNAFFVNVARGDVVDEAALTRALKEGRIAGAGLDVFQQEPLPPESPLWEMPNVIVTPHTSGAIVDYATNAAKFFAENLKRFANGQPLMNVVDKQKGY